MSSSLNVDSAIQSIPDRKVPMSVMGAAGAAMVFGLAGFGYGMVTNPAWAWGAVLVGMVYVLGLSAGGLIFSVIATLTWARWSRPLKRVAEGFAVFLPIGWALLVVFLVAANGLYPWNPNTFVEGGPVALEPHSPAVLFASKPVWLSLPFFIARNTLGVGLLVGLGLLYLRASLKPDLMLAKQKLGPKAPGWWGSIIGGDTDVAKAAEAGANFQSASGPWIAITYAIVITFMYVDLVMTLSPWWYSNMFGGWMGVNTFWCTIATLGFTTMVGRDWLGLTGWVTKKTQHDLGRMALAFTMAYAYMLFSQLLPIWYANMPEETDFLMVRMFLPQWSWMAKTVATLCFLMPFTVLLSRGIKKMRWGFAAICTVIMIGVFFDRTLLVLPSVYKGETFPWDLFLVTSVGVWLGFLGLFFTVVTQFLARVPTLVVSDPKLETHPWDEHVHSLDAHHAH